MHLVKVKVATSSNGDGVSPVTSFLALVFGLEFRLVFVILFSIKNAWELIANLEARSKQCSCRLAAIWTKCRCYFTR